MDISHFMHYSPVVGLFSIRIVSTVWLLRKMRLHTFTYMSLCVHIFSFLLGRFLGVECLGSVNIYLTF